MHILVHRVNRVSLEGPQMLWRKNLKGYIDTGLGEFPPIPPYGREKGDPPAPFLAVRPRGLLQVMHPPYPKALTGMPCATMEQIDYPHDALMILMGARGARGG